MSAISKPRIVATSAAAVLALIAASCGTQSNAPVPTANPGPYQTVPYGPMPTANPGTYQTVPAQQPGAQPTAPAWDVSGPEIAEPPGDVNLPYRTPGDQPVDPGTIVVVPEAPPAPPTLPPDSEPTPTTEPSEQLPIPEVP
jgi:hypothetical protein